MRSRLAFCCLLFGVGCTSPSGPTFSGTVSDPAGDAFVFDSVPLPPDLIAATIDISGTDLILTVSYKPGTLSQTLTKFQALLDIDENPATGFGGVDEAHTDAPLIGVDYMIVAVSPRASGQGQVSQIDSVGHVTSTGTVTLTFPTADQAKVTVPLSMLGNDDGKLKFKVTVSQFVTDIGSTGIIDVMPNVGLAPGQVR